MQVTMEWMATTLRHQFGRKSNVLLSLTNDEKLLIDAVLTYKKHL